MLSEGYFLLEPSVTEELPVIQILKKQFASMLPSQFGEPYFVPSPVVNLPSVLRANCTKKGCSVRAFVHLTRENGNGELRIKEKNPRFDRFGNVCDQCKKIKN